MVHALVACVHYLLSSKQSNIKIEHFTEKKAAAITCCRKKVESSCTVLFLSIYSLIRSIYCYVCMQNGIAAQ